MLEDYLNTSVMISDWRTFVLSCYKIRSSEIWAPTDSPSGTPWVGGKKMEESASHHLYATEHQITIENHQSIRLRLRGSVPITLNLEIVVPRKTWNFEEDGGVVSNASEKMHFFGTIGYVFDLSENIFDAKNMISLPENNFRCKNYKFLHQKNNFRYQKNDFWGIHQKLTKNG